MKKLFLTVCVFAATVFSANAQKVDPVVKNIIEIHKTDNQTMKHLDVLTNRFGGRMVGSDAYENSLQWVESKFKEWGLDEVWIEEAGVAPVGFNRGPWFGRVLGEEAMTLDFVTPSYTSGTCGVQKGHVLIEPKTRAEFNRMKHVLKGAWVLITGRNRGWAIAHDEEANARRAAMIAENEEIAKKNAEITRNNRANGTNEPMLEYKDEPALFYKEMVEAGILGIIQSSNIPMTALYDKTVLNDPTMTLEKLPTTADIKLNRHQYAKIYTWAKERRRFELEFQIRNHFKMGPIKYYNITGVIKGSKYPNEYVMSSGHLDAYDAGTGGVDCGVGVTATMEAARMVAQAGGKPKRSMLFTLFAAEEIGLVGSKAWIATHKDKLDKISNLFNRDGGPTVPTGIMVPQSQYDDYVKASAGINELNPDFPFEVKLREKPIVQPKKPGGHDGAVFMCAGVPAIGFSLGDVKGYNFSYGEIWHTDRDLYNKNIPEYQMHTSAVTAIMMYNLANLDHVLSREGLYTPAK